MKKLKKKIFVLSISICLLFFSVGIYRNFEFNSQFVATNANGQLSNKKICWGIKREADHKQPDVGKNNKVLIDKYGGICLGNVESNKVYLTFDSGYEAGYMEKILEVLKQNNVKACFFITAHYLNTQPELVQKMIDDGHIIRKSHS